MEPTAKRARKGRRKVTAGSQGAGLSNDDDADRLRMGTKRLKAIRSLLEGSTEISFDLMVMHLVWAGDYSVCSFCDVTLGLPWLWPKSLPPPDSTPDEVQMVCRDASSRQSQELIPAKISTANMKYGEPLTATQHNMMIDKTKPSTSTKMKHCIWKVHLAD